MSSANACARVLHWLSELVYQGYKLSTSPVLIIPVHCGSQLQDAEQNRNWVPWSGEDSMMPNTPSCSVSLRDPLPHTRLAPHFSHWSLLRNRGSTPSANDSHNSPLSADMLEKRQKWINAWSPMEHKQCTFLAACNNCPGCSWWAPSCQLCRAPEQPGQTPCLTWQWLPRGNGYTAIS